MNDLRRLTYAPDAHGNYFATFPVRPGHTDRKHQDTVNSILSMRGLTFATLATAISFPGAPNADVLIKWFTHENDGYAANNKTIALSYVNAILALLQPLNTPVLVNPDGPDSIQCSREALWQALGFVRIDDD